MKRFHYVWIVVVVTFLALLAAQALALRISTSAVGTRMPAPALEAARP